MVFVTADNNSVSLRKLTVMILEKYPGSVVYEFTDPMLSAKYICNHPVDVVLAQENMRPVDGAILLEVLHIHKPDLSVILLQENLERETLEQQMEEFSKNDITIPCK